MMSPEDLLVAIDGDRRDGTRGIAWLADNAEDSVVVKAFWQAESARTRRVLIALMGHKDIPEAAPILVECLDDVDPDVRQLAADSLGRIVGYPPRRPELRDEVLAALRRRAVMEDLGWVRSTVLQSLGLLGGVADRPVLEAALESPDRQVRGQAAWALNRITTEAW